MTSKARPSKLRDDRDKSVGRQSVVIIVQTWSTGLVSHQVYIDISTCPRVVSSLEGSPGIFKNDEEIFMQSTLRG